MHVYEIADGSIVIADDESDAWRVWGEHTMLDRASEGYTDRDIWQLSPEQGISVEDAGEDGAAVELTAAGWIEREGRGWLCTTD